MNYDFLLPLYYTSAVAQLVLCLILIVCHMICVLCNECYVLDTSQKNIHSKYIYIFQFTWSDVTLHSKYIFEIELAVLGGNINFLPTKSEKYPSHREGIWDIMTNSSISKIEEDWKRSQSRKTDILHQYRCSLVPVKWTITYLHPSVLYINGRLLDL